MLTVEANVMEGVITSSPSSSLRDFNIRCMPAVAELNVTACFAPVSWQNLSSNALHRAPVVIQPDFRQEITPLISVSPTDGRLKGKKSFLIFIEF